MKKLLKSGICGSMNSAWVHCLWVLQIPLFSHFFIKNRSHDTIHIFKNYFPTVFSVTVFNFNKNKLNPNGPYTQNKQTSLQKVRE